MNIFTGALACLTVCLTFVFVVLLPNSFYCHLVAVVHYLLPDFL